MCSINALDLVACSNEAFHSADTGGEPSPQTTVDPQRLSGVARQEVAQMEMPMVELGQTSKSQPHGTGTYCKYTVFNSKRNV